MEVLAAIRESSDRFTQPDDEYGYGIPDFNLAHVLLNYQPGYHPENVNMITFPNPFSTDFYILFSLPRWMNLDVSLIDLSGQGGIS